MLHDSNSRHCSIYTEMILASCASVETWWCPSHQIVLSFNTREIGGRILTVETRLPNELPEFDGDFLLEGLQFWKMALSAMTQNARPVSPAFTGSRHSAAQRDGVGAGTAEDCKIIILPCKSPPSLQRVQLWLQAKREYDHSRRCSRSQETGANRDGCLPPSPAEQASSSERVAAPASAAPAEEQTAEDSHDTDPSPEPPPLKTPEHGNGNAKQRSPSQAAKVAELLEDEDDYYGAYSSPDSPLTSPWQQPASPDPRPWEPNEGSKQPTEPTPESSERSAGDLHSPTHSGTGHSDEQLDDSPLHYNPAAAVRHSTPVAHTKRKDGIPDVLYCTPIQMGE